MADEPQDFHPLLHSRMVMFKALLVQGLLILFRIYMIAVGTAVAGGPPAQIRT